MYTETNRSCWSTLIYTEYLLQECQGSKYCKQCYYTKHTLSNKYQLKMIFMHSSRLWFKEIRAQQAHCQAYDYIVKLKSSLKFWRLKTQRNVCGFWEMASELLCTVMPTLAYLILLSTDAESVFTINHLRDIYTGILGLRILQILCDYTFFTRFKWWNKCCQQQQQCQRLQSSSLACTDEFK